MWKDSDWRRFNDVKEGLIHHTYGEHESASQEVEEERWVHLNAINNFIKFYNFLFTDIIPMSI